MQNRDLAGDYIERATIRIEAIEVLYKHKSWANVVSECQEAIELALKAMLRSHGIEVPRIHDVSGIILKEAHRLPQELDLKKLASISKDLRRDREIAFYGSEDLTPSEFYNEEDAQKALEGAKFVVAQVRPTVPSKA